MPSDDIDRATHGLRRITELLEDIVGDLTALNDAITKLTTDVNTLLAGQTDQAAIDAATANVTALDQKVTAALPPQTPAPA